MIPQRPEVNIIFELRICYEERKGVKTCHNPLLFNKFETTSPDAHLMHPQPRPPGVVLTCDHPSRDCKVAVSCFPDSGQLTPDH